MTAKLVDPQSTRWRTMRLNGLHWSMRNTQGENENSALTHLQASVCHRNSASFDNFEKLCQYE